MNVVVYKITNRITNKCYIGWTSKGITQRWSQHTKDAIKSKDNRPFYNAIRKYGIDCWDIEILEELQDKAAGKEREIYYISLYESYSKGYNGTKGGDGNNCIVMSAESNLARSVALKGKPKGYAGFLGKTHSEESRKKISQSKTGQKAPWIKWTSEQVLKRSRIRRALDKEQYDTIQKLRKNGDTIKSIAEATGINHHLVKKWMNRPWE
jgi:group I intron endonuclease